MKYYVIAGEASGDLHASNLIGCLKIYDSFAQFRGWGGNLMKTQGVEICKHINDLAFFGISEVIGNLRTISNNFKLCKQDIITFNPDVLILVDYPGFNLRIAKFAKLKGIKVFYYISPTIWAWHQSRIYIIKKFVDKMFVILPFEKEFYKKFNVDVEYEGHPLLDAIEHEQNNFLSKNEFCTKYNLLNKPIIAVLPGSRKNEIKRKLPLMMKVVNHFNEYQFVIAGTNSVPIDFYKQFLISDDVKIIFGKTYQILKIADTAIVTSGTATLETALFNVPQVVCYKTSFLTYVIAKIFVKVKYISLVNIILNKGAITELIQNKLTLKNLIKELKLLTNSSKREQIIEDYKKINSLIGSVGASQRIAKQMVELLKSNKG